MGPALKHPLRGPSTSGHSRFPGTVPSGLLSTWRTVYTLFHKSPPPTLLSALHRREDTAEAVVSMHMTIKTWWNLGGRGACARLHLTVKKVTSSTGHEGSPNQRPTTEPALKISCFLMAILESVEKSMNTQTPNS